MSRSYYQWRRRSSMAWMKPFAPSKQLAHTLNCSLPGDEPSDSSKCSSCSPPGPSWGLYSVVNIKRCSSVRWIVLESGFRIQIREATWWVMKAVHTGVLFDVDIDVSYSDVDAAYLLSSFFMTDACKRIPPESRSLNIARACWNPSSIITLDHVSSEKKKKE